MKRCPHAVAPTRRGIPIISNIPTISQLNAARMQNPAGEEM
jgi:hypothetical protein